ncbi:MAG: conjugal transfer protein TraH [Oxalobacteraceae bacterium]|nr:MAG: conjugal transfer protein TraH [Oxalobacteraceae bacterium]
MTQPSEDELLEAALAAVDQPLPQPPEPPEPDSHEPTQPPPSEPPSAASPTLEALEESRRPQAKTVCEDCPNSVWFSSPAEVKCYCRVMFLVTWSNKEPNQLTACDGIFLGQDD